MTTNYSGNVTLYTLNKNQTVSSLDFLMKVKLELISSSNRVYKVTITSSQINQILLASSIEKTTESSYDSNLDEIQGYLDKLLYAFKNDDDENDDDNKKIKSNDGGNDNDGDNDGDNDNDNDFNYNRLTVQISGLFRGNNINIKGTINKLLL